MNNLVPDSNGRRFRTLRSSDPMRLVDDLMMWQPRGPEVLWPVALSPARVTHADDGATLTVDMPGVDPSDLELTFERGSLSIAGKRGDHVYRYTVELGDKVDPDAIEARLDKGVLTVRAGIRPEAKPRKIRVASGVESR